MSNDCVGGGSRDKEQSESQIIKCDKSAKTRWYDIINQMFSFKLKSSFLSREKRGRINNFLCLSR